MMREWNAIDLHMHTCEGITRDKTKDNVKFEYIDLQEAIEKYKLKLLAVTNHNTINIPNYILMRHLAKIQNTRVLLGVELDTNLSVGLPIHIATIFEEDFKSNFNVTNEINMVTKEKLKEKEVAYTNEEIVSILGKYDVIMIPHGNKDKGVFKNAGGKEIEEALKKIREGFIRIFDSPSDWKLKKIKNFLEEIGEENLDEFGGVLFSDVRDWSNYNEKYRNFYMNAEPTFKGILHSISNPTARFKPFNEIRENNNYIAKIVFSKNNDKSRIEDGEINLSNGYNCIIGKSGSGKSLLLHLIKKNLLRDSEENLNYKFSENTNVKIYNEEGRLLNAETINLGIGANLYSKIIVASSTNDNDDLYSIIGLLNSSFKKEEKFSEFKNEYNEKIKSYVELKSQINSNKQSLITNRNKLFNDIKRLQELSETKIFDVKIIESKAENKYINENVSEFNKYEEDITSLKEKIKEYNGKYEKQIEELIEALRKKLYFAKLDMENEKQKNELKDFKIRIINNSIEKINASKSSQAKEKAKLIKSIPIDRDKIIKTILETKLNNIISENFDLSIKKEKINSEKEINKNVMVIESVANEMINNVNEKENQLFATNRYKGKLNKEKNYNMTNKKEAKEIIDKYITVGLIKEGKDIISDDFKLNIQIKFDGQDIKEMNPGNIAKKYIQIYFEEQIQNGKNNVVIFDQIENDVDKEFINDVIRDLIGGTKGNVQIIIVTHDPIVAVNADPNNYIESTKNEKNKFTYRSFVPESYEKDELTTIACNVDGSKEAIRGRYEIYEGEKINGN